MQAQGMIRRRVVIAAGLSIMAFALIGLRLVDVMVLKRQTAGAPAALVDLSPSRRGDLLDRNGILLARDLPTEDLYARPASLRNHAHAARDLALATGVDLRRLSLEFAEKHNYALVARRLTPDVQDRVKRLHLPGLEFD